MKPESAVKQISLALLSRISAALKHATGVLLSITQESWDAMKAERCSGNN
jgi:hypothetical protein